MEHYIVSTGFAEVIRGSALMPYVDGVWGCELIEEPDGEGNPVISEIGYTIDNTTKTRAIFEINKGILKLDNISVNSKIPKEHRRVRFENMIYIADGPSDIPAFSVVNQYGGATFAIYPKGDLRAMQQVDQMRQDGRVDMYAEADYSEGTTAYLWILNKIQTLADGIRDIGRWHPGAGKGKNIAFCIGCTQTSEWVSIHCNTEGQEKNAVMSSRIAYDC